jgi:hypothetical protein
VSQGLGGIDSRAVRPAIRVTRYHFTQFAWPDQESPATLRNSMSFVGPPRAFASSGYPPKTTLTTSSPSPRTSGRSSGRRCFGNALLPIIYTLVRDPSATRKMLYALARRGELGERLPRFPLTPPPLPLGDRRPGRGRTSVADGLRYASLRYQRSRTSAPADGYQVDVARHF